MMVFAMNYSYRFLPIFLRVWSTIFYVQTPLPEEAKKVIVVQNEEIANSVR
ncbi:hypothetical protein WN51_08604 [Melipona quadrifasciata]|uniref:Uncharacterized protein n=1 Tax=Melipona quadrifasciata TaxID=166423 RepID=A0A0M9A7J3_9HYME|nr:hypothetical protein WN51_08604 [Melipona quadrifasciata]